MSSIKKLSFIGLAVILVMSSCTMEKRVYLSGYHIEWKKSKHNSDQQELVSNDNVQQKEQNHTVTIEASVNETNTTNSYFEQEEFDDNLTASLDNEQINLPSREIINFHTSSNNIVNPGEEEMEIKPSFKSEFKKGAKVILAKAGEPRTNGLALAGFICSIVGLVFYGILLGLLAIVFSTIGLGMIRKHSSKWNGKGFAIAGLIIGIIDFIAWLLLLALILL